MSIEKSDELIAKFMGATPCKNFWNEEALEHKDWSHDEYTNTTQSYFETCAYKISQLRYSNSWEWLMPVIEKISKKQFTCNAGGKDEHTDTYYPRTFGMINQETKQFMFRFNTMFLHQSDSLIDAAYEAVVEILEVFESEK